MGIFLLISLLSSLIICSVVIAIDNGLFMKILIITFSIIFDIVVSILYHRTGKLITLKKELAEVTSNLENLKRQRAEANNREPSICAIDEYIQKNHNVPSLSRLLKAYDNQDFSDDLSKSIIAKLSSDDIKDSSNKYKLYMKENHVLYKNNAGVYWINLEVGLIQPFSFSRAIVNKLDKVIDEYKKDIELEISYIDSYNLVEKLFEEEEWAMIYGFFMDNDWSKPLAEVKYFYYSNNDDFRPFSFYTDQVVAIKEYANANIQSESCDRFIPIKHVSALTIA
jgi:hypothetical protein